MWLTLLRRTATLVFTVLLTSFLAAVMMRYAPGFNSDEQQLDARLNADSQQALRDAHEKQQNVVAFYGSYLAQAVRGNFGDSQTLNRPVKELLKERAPVTLRIAGLGLLLGWFLALSLAVTISLLRSRSLGVFGMFLAGTLLCLPSAVLAFLSVVFNGPGFLAIALIVFPKAFSYTRNLLASSYDLPHVLTARARGLSELRVLIGHVFPVVGAPMIALAGVSVSVALSAAIPIEAICGIGGIGQLAWQAAMGRDLPLLINLTMLITIVVTLSNMSADVANVKLEGAGA